MHILRDRINKLGGLSVEYLFDTAVFVHPSFGSVEMARRRVEQALWDFFVSRMLEDSTVEDNVDIRERRCIHVSKDIGHHYRS